MNETLTPIEKIDQTLNFILNANKPPFVTFSEILDSIQLKFKCDSKELIEILHTLEKDGHIFSEVRDSNSIREYKSTFYGRMFAANDGYRGVISRQSAESNRLDAVEAYQRGQARTLNRLTGWIAGGTIALAVIELWKMALEYHWFSFCH